MINIAILQNTNVINGEKYKINNSIHEKAHRATSKRISGTLTAGTDE